jgi:hypothetical protein
MRTIRRLYFYLIALISLETVIWGSIYLAHSIVKSGSIVLPSADLAGGFSLVLVGLPIFLLHWLMAQRDAGRDEEERTSRVRALFLYGMRLATLIPIVHNSIAIANRLILQAVGMNPADAWFGGSDTFADSIVTIGINLVALLYMETVIRGEWKQGQPEPAFPETRRLFRLAWKIYTFGLMVIGVQQIWYWVFASLGNMFVGSRLSLANAIVLTLIGAPLWAWIWIFIQKQQNQMDENRSVMRSLVLFLLAVGGALTCIPAAFVLISDLAMWATGRATTVVAFLSDHALPLSLLIVAGLVWLYFDKQWKTPLAGESKDAPPTGARRFYEYLLALYGFGFLFSGMLWLGFLVVDLIMKPLVVETLREGLCGAFAAVLVGVGVWFRRWQNLQREVREAGEPGHRARRSLVRKSILYLLIFSGVVGVMGAAGFVFYLIIDTMLGGSQGNFTLELLYRMNVLLMVGVWLAYYLRSLITDGRHSQQDVHTARAAYPVILVGFEECLAMDIAQILQRSAPQIPVTCITMGNVPDANVFQTAKAIVLPLGSVLRLPEEIQMQVRDFNGPRIGVPIAEAGWVWMGGSARKERDQARDVAKSIVQLSEGQDVRGGTSNGLTIVVAIIGGLITLQVILRLLDWGMMLMSK